MYKIRNIFLVFIVSFSIAFGIGTERSFLNNSIYSEEQQYSSWTIESVQAGQDFYLLWAKDDQGKDHIYTWGKNLSAQLGDGTKTNNYTPTEISYGREWNSLDEGWEIQQVDVGFLSTMVVVEDVDGNDHLYGWGENSYYDLGLGVNNDISIPKEIDYGNSKKPEEITDVSASGNLSIISTLDSSGNNHFYTTGTVQSGGLGNGDNEGKNETFKEIVYRDSDLKSSSTYTLKAVFADGPSNISSSSVNTDEACYIWTEDDQGVDHIYGTGGNHNGGLLGEKSNSDHVTSFTEINFNESSDIKIKQFYSSSVTIDGNLIKNYKSDGHFIDNTFYSGIVYTDASNKDHLYTWGGNYNANLGNGSIDTVWQEPSGIIEENKLTDGSTALPKNYRIDYVEANSFNNYAVITDQDTNQQHIYFWGASRGEGLSTYEENTDIAHYKGDYYDAPIEINYPDLNFKTNRVINISGSFYDTFLLTEDDNQIQHLYIWGNNSNNLVSESTHKIIYQPTLIFNSVNIIDTKVDIIDKNNINYTFTVENGNELKSIIMNDDQGKQNSFSEEDWKVTDSDQYSTTYSLRVDDLLDGTYDFDQVFYNSYFNLTITNSGEKILIKSGFFYIWIIILVALILILIILFLLLIYLKKRKSKLKLKMERDIYIS